MAAAMLEHLGLNRHLAVLYVWLCERGPVDAKSMAAAVPHDSVQTSLAALEKASLIYAIHMGHGKTMYEVTPIRLALQGHCFDRLWREVPSQTHLASIGKGISDAYTSWEKTSSTNANRMQPLAPLPQPFRRPRSEVSLGSISGYLLKTLPRARHIIRAIVAPPWMGSLPMIWSAVTYACSRGATYKRLSDWHSFLEFGYAINRRDTQDVGVQLRITREPATAIPKLYMVDDAVSIRLRERQGSATCQVSENPIEIDEHKEEFLRLWNASVSSETLLAVVASERERLISEAASVLSRREQAAFRLLIDYGVFATARHVENLFRLTGPDIEAWRGKLLMNGLVFEARSGLGVLAAVRVEANDSRIGAISTPKELSVTHKVLDVLRLIDDPGGLRRKEIQTQLSIGGTRLGEILQDLQARHWIRVTTSRRTRGFETTAEGKAAIALRME